MYGVKREVITATCAAFATGCATCAVLILVPSFGLDEPRSYAAMLQLMAVLGILVGIENYFHLLTRYILSRLMLVAIIFIAVVGLLGSPKVDTISYAVTMACIVAWAWRKIFDRAPASLRAIHHR